MINSVNLSRQQVNSYKGLSSLEQKKSKRKEGKVSARRKMKLRGQQIRDKVELKNKNHKFSQNNGGTKIGKVVEFAKQGKYQLHSPVRTNTIYISSRFGEDRGSYIHKGLDIDGKAGDNIYAAKKGKVVFSGYTERGGNEVVVKHDNGLMTKYSHLDQLNVEQGDKVTHKTVLGTMGSTGKIYVADDDGDTAHLHYEVIKDGKNIDPEPFIDAQKTEYKRGDYGSGSCGGSYSGGSCGGSSSGGSSGGSCSSSNRIRKEMEKKIEEKRREVEEEFKKACEAGTCSGNTNLEETEETNENGETEGTDETDNSNEIDYEKVIELSDNLEGNIDDFNYYRGKYNKFKEEFEDTNTMSDWKHTRSFAKKMVDTAYKIKNSKDKLVAYLGNDKEVAVPPSQAQLIYEDRVQLGDFIPARPENPSVDKDFSYINITSNKTWKYDGRKLAIKSVASWAQTIASNFLSKKVGIGVSILGAFKSQSGAVDIKPSHNDTMKISTKIWGTKDGKLNVDVTYKFKHEDTENLAEVPDVTVTKVYDDITWEYDEEASRREGMPIFEYQNIEEDIGDIKDIYDVDRYQGEEGL